MSSELSSGILGRSASTYLEDPDAFRDLGLITVKPCLYVGNIEDISEENPFLKELTLYANERNSVVLPMCNQLEAEIAELEEAEEQTMFLKELGLEKPGIHYLIQSTYKLLKLQTYFTAGPKEVRAWTITKGTKAPKAAGIIHTDFEKGFIRAEVMSYDNFILLKSEQACRDNGKLSVEGKDYVVNDGDIVHFRFNV